LEPWLPNESIETEKACPKTSNTPYFLLSSGHVHIDPVYALWCTLVSAVASAHLGINHLFSLFLQELFGIYEYRVKIESKYYEVRWKLDEKKKIMVGRTR